jgi:YD repeat-containing protein
MTQRESQEVLDRDPFQGVKITLSSGESVDVTNPRMVVAMPNQFFIALADGRYQLIWLRHVVSVETPPGRSAGFTYDQLGRPSQVLVAMSNGVAFGHLQRR